MNSKEALLSSKFGKYSQTQISRVATANVVVYTRVSTKEQADKNLSLETQRKTIEEYALRQKLNIVAYFGGTYESAKTDGRKEFMRMLDFLKKGKGQISQLLVYTLDRFSRTGGAAIKIAQDLREKHGVGVFAVTQPADTSNPSGVLHQNIQLLFSEFDNQQRRQRMIAGMTEKFKQGYWVVKPPQGYDIIKVNGNRTIVVSEEGKKIKKAFEWKLMGMKNEEIVARLRKLGARMYKQQIHKIFTNPFYCGLISHGMLNGQVVEGKHEAMIDKATFFKINDIILQSTKSGVPHNSQNDKIPLKVFIKCGECEEPFTGYIMKKRGLYYYKCRTNGCRCNKSAKQMHLQFMDYLGQHSLKEGLLKAFLFNLEHEVGDEVKDYAERENALKCSFIEATKKVDTIEKKFYVLDEMGKEAFDKFHPKLKDEQEKARRDLADLTKSISNIEVVIRMAVEISLNLQCLWDEAGIKMKERLQKLVFPEGIIYEKLNSAFRTIKKNEIFELVADVLGHAGGSDKGTTPFLLGQSLLAERAGFEPAVPFDRYDSLANCSFRPLRHLSRQTF